MFPQQGMERRKPLPLATHDDDVTCRNIGDSLDGGAAYKMSVAWLPTEANKPHAYGKRAECLDSEHITESTIKIGASEHFGHHWLAPKRTP